MFFRCRCNHCHCIAHRPAVNRWYFEKLSEWGPGFKDVLLKNGTVMCPNTNCQPDQGYLVSIDKTRSFKICNVPVKDIAPLIDMKYKAVEEDRIAFESRIEEAKNELELIMVNAHADGQLSGHYENLLPDVVDGSWLFRPENHAGWGSFSNIGLRSDFYLVTLALTKYYEYFIGPCSIGDDFYGEDGFIEKRFAQFEKMKKLIMSNYQENSPKWLKYEDIFNSYVANVVRTRDHLELVSGMYLCLLRGMALDIRIQKGWKNNSHDKDLARDFVSSFCIISLDLFLQLMFD